MWYNKQFSLYHTTALYQIYHTMVNIKIHLDLFCYFYCANKIWRFHLTVTRIVNSHCFTVLIHRKMVTTIESWFLASVLFLDFKIYIIGKPVALSFQRYNFFCKIFSITLVITLWKLTILFSGPPCSSTLHWWKCAPRRFELACSLIRVIKEVISCKIKEKSKWVSSCTFF